MRLLLLGTAAAGGLPGRAESCILVEAGGLRFLLDAGPGCGSRLLEHGMSACSLDAVYISHLHLDHWAGLFDLAVQAAARRCRPPVVAVPEDLLEEANAVIPGLMPRSVRELMQPRPVGETPLAGVLEPVESSHSIPCWGALIRSGGRLVYYSSDTRLTRRTRELASAASVAVVEATLPPGMLDAAEATGHMTVDQALGLVEAMRPGSTLVLTHLSQESLESLRGVLGSRRPRGVVVASDGLEVIV